MAEAKKDTIYIDVDDEITSLVEKVQSSGSNIVALVLPKRAVVLQSIVNMKLLKRASDEASKRVVLITSEDGLMPLAGAVGVYTAKNLQSKPEIPAAPEDESSEDELFESEEEQDDKELDKDAAVGALAGTAMASSKADSQDESSDVFEDSPSKGSAPKAEKPEKKAKAKKDKKSKVPNFEKFRLKVIIGVVAVIALLVLSYIAFFVAPRATVAITTETNDINTSIDFTASLDAESVDATEAVVPATVATETEEDTQTTPATGKKDLGSKATGSVRLSIACSDVSGNPPTVPAGTGVSTGGLTFITQSSTSLTTPSFNGGCQFVGDTGVTAQKNGDEYNIGNGKTFNVAGFGDISGANGGGFSGGSSKIATVVTQQDIDIATEKLQDNEDAIRVQLTSQLEKEELFVLEGTFNTTDDSTSTSPQAGAEGSQVSVTRKQTYSMLGVSQDDLKTLIDANVESQANERSAQVQDYGLEEAVFRLENADSNSSQLVTMQVQVALGPEINVEQLKEDIAGKKKGDVQNIVKGIQGVQDVEVSYSPFWVNSTPKKTSKIIIDFKEANTE